MSKKEKINWIKWWLQRYGERDDSVFHIEIESNEITWDISLQYNYGDNGLEYDPFDWCSNGFKHTFMDRISYRSDEELDEIISILKQRIEQ